MQIETQRGKRKHSFLPKHLRTDLPPLYSTENETDPIVYVKYFSPFCDLRWYAIEFDGVDTCFGYTVGLVSECGYFSLSELEMLTATYADFAIPFVERDIYWEPCALADVISGIVT